MYERIHKIIILMICAVCSFSLSIVRAQKITIDGLEFRVGSNRIWMNGANTPWNNWNDFGGSFDYNWWNNHFQELQDNGINSSRIWFSCNGDVAPYINSSGYVTGVPQAFWDDCDQLFQIAQDKGIYIMATVISFDHFKSANATGWRNMVGSEATIQSFIDVYLLPFVDRYENNPYLFSVDLCNEIEWVHENSECGQLPWIDLQRYIAMCAAAIHQNSDVLVTNGSACIKWGSDLYEGNYWSDAALQAAYSSQDAYLDYYHVHYYGWQHQWFSSPFEMSPADYQINDRPVVVGECPAQDMPEIPVTITQALENALANGYQGTFPWTSNGVDANGSLTTLGPATTSFKDNHYALVYPGGSPSQAPYGGTPAAVPGTIEAENYDTGGEGLAYHDTDTGNNGGQYRSEDVDIESCGEGGYNVGWIEPGEWLEYTVDVASAGDYDIEIRVARSPTGSSSLHMESNGTDITGTMSVPGTGGWQNWTSIYKTGVSLSAGEQVLRLYMDGGSFNVNNITITASNQPPAAAITSPSDGATFTEPADITITADASDSDGNVTLVEFFNGASKLGQDSSSPYQYDWNNVAAGNYTLTVKATDDEGAVTTSDPVNVDVQAGGTGGNVAIAGSWTAGTSHAKESGTDRLLVLTAHVEHSESISLDAVSYGGRSMTRVYEQTASTGYVAYTAVFILNESGITAATNGSFSASWSASPAQNPGYTSVFLTGVDQMSPVGNSDGNSSTSGSVATSALSTNDGDMVILAATCGNTGTFSTANGFTEALELSLTSSDGIAGYKHATGANETPGVSHTNVNRQSIAGLVVRAGGGSPVQNLVQNPEFDDGTNHWGIDNNGGADAVVTAVSNAGLSGANAAHVTMSSGGTEIWHIQFEQVFGLESGKTYEITFMAKADASKQIQLTFQQTVSPYTNYWVYYPIDIGTSAATYGPYTFDCNVTDAAAKFKFHLGGNSTAIYIDKVMITETGLSKPFAGETDQTAVSTAYELCQNYPNPFNPVTRISYHLPEAVHVNLKIYDVTGRHVRDLVDARQSAGRHHLIFNAADLTTGAYLYRLQAGPFCDMKKMIFVK